MRRPPGRESGQLTVVVVGVIVSTLIALAGAVAVTRAISAAHSARSAADLAALAGAAQVVRGEPLGACAAAARLARANGASISSCSVEPDGSVVVAVMVTISPRWGQTAHAVARAGPG